MKRLFERDIYEMEWSELFLWSSLILSATMLAGVLVWNVATSLRISWQLETKGVKTCVALNHRVGGGEASAETTAMCEALVKKRHDRCMSEALAEEDERFAETRSDYMTCVMADGLGDATMALGTTR